MNIRPIKTEKDHAHAMRELTALLEKDPPENSADADRLEILSTLIEKYENDHFPIEDPTPVEAIRFRMDQLGLTRKDLIPYIGSASKVSEILNGKRSLSISMIRALHDELGIPADVLISTSANDDSRRNAGKTELPLKQMWEFGYFGSGKSWSYIRNNYESLTASLVAKAHIDVMAPAYCRSTAHYRDGKQLDKNALRMWQAHVIVNSHRRRVPKYRPGVVNKKLMEDVAKLSVLKSGPLLARELLENVGIPVLIEPHLNHTYLDGAAFLRKDGVPIIGLTIRHDRLDNFWFTLMHELVHVGWHLNEGQDTFFDDLESDDTDAKEREADSIAAETLIPQSKFEGHDINSLENILSLSRELMRHPAIIVGRLQHETGDFKLFAKLVGRNRVRRQFEES